MINVVDTHALVWYFEGTDELGVEAGRILADESSALVVPTIVLAEAKYLATRKQLAVTWPQMLERVKFDSRFKWLILTSPWSRDSTRGSKCMTPSSVRLPYFSPKASGKSLRCLPAIAI